MNIFTLLFSFRGSIARFEYLAGIAIGVLVVCVGLVLPHWIIGENNLSNTMKVLKAALYLSSLIMMIVMHFALGAKRLRNLQWSQWLLILCAIPFANMLMQMIFIFAPGKTVNRAMT